MEPKKSGRGGYRPGAGRKPNPQKKLSVSAAKCIAIANQSESMHGSVDGTLAHKDPKEFLLALMNEQEADIKLRAEAAKALMPFMHQKLGEGGKKDQKQAEAKKAATGKFAASTPPKLVASGGSRL